MSPLEAQVALNMVPGIGPIRCRRLIDHLGSAQEVLSAPKDVLLSIHGFGPELVSTLMDWENRCDPVAEIVACKSRDIKLVTPEDDSYPPLLHEMYDSPLLLYVWGDLSTQDQQTIAMVGSRRCSHYGLQTTRKLAYQLAASGRTIVSGLARGIDTAAHEAAIAADGRTIAIIGSGLDQLYPIENTGLAKTIASGHGAVISEYPLHTRPDKGTFPMRNRLIAGWSPGLITIECPEKSGALITANLAADYGRSVFVVPGPIDCNSFCGSHRLIRDGATLITDGSEVLNDLEGSLATRKCLTEAPKHQFHLSAEQTSVLDQLSSLEVTTDELVERCGLPAAAINRCLAMLEIHGLVKSSAGARYVKA